jgi:uncharacterized damage-inducible protein DinB
MESAMSDLLDDFRHEFSRYRSAAERAMASLSDEQFFERPAPHVNSVAIVVKHLAGNLVSRWTEFLTTDGDKPSRDRDNEFIITPHDTRASLLEAWQRGWQAVFDTLDNLTNSDLEKIVTIRREPHTVFQALLRASGHAAYHTGQILYLVRLLCPESPWLTIPPGQSRAHRGEYRKPV